MQMNNKRRITEKQFLRALISSVCSIILCLTCLVGTTWAWFSLTIFSENNTIQVGVFNTDVAVTANNGGETIPASGDLMYDLPAGEYTVRISSSADNTVPGYCIVKLADQVFETIRLNPIDSGAEKPSTVEFTVKIGEPAQQTGSEDEGEAEQQTREIYTASLQIVPMWGNPEGAGELLGAAITEITNGVEAESDPESEPSDDTDDSTPDDSAPDDSTPDDSTPDDSAPDDSAPDDSTPDDSTPDDSTPDDSTPDESTPTESTPTESTPTESTPTESTPTESTPTESTPTESTPTESTPTESTPTESTPTESTPTESTPNDSTGDNSGTQTSENEETTATKDTENTSES